MKTQINEKLLESELYRSKQLMENIVHINKSDLDKTWSADYMVNKKHGLVPYDKHGYLLIALETPQHKIGTINGPGDIRKSQPHKLKTAVYLKQENADELNQIGQQIQFLIDQYNEKFQQYSK